MLQERDCEQFFNTMLEEIEVHEKCEHWTLMNRNDMPTGSKTLWQSGPSSASGTQMEALTNTRIDYVLTEDNKPEAKTTGILMHPLSHGIVHDYY